MLCGPTGKLLLTVRVKVPGEGVPFLVPIQLPTDTSWKTAAEDTAIGASNPNGVSDPRVVTSICAMNKQVEGFFPPLCVHFLLCLCHSAAQMSEPTNEKLQKKTREEEDTTFLSFRGLGLIF